MRSIAKQAPRPTDPRSGEGNPAPATTIKGKGLTSVSPFVFRAECAHKTPSFCLRVA